MRQPKFAAAAIIRIFTVQSDFIRQIRVCSFMPTSADCRRTAATVYSVFIFTKGIPAPEMQATHLRIPVRITIKRTADIRVIPVICRRYSETTVTLCLWFLRTDSA